MSSCTALRVTPHLMRGPAYAHQRGAHAWRQRRVHGFSLGGGNDSETRMTMGLRGCLRANTQVGPTEKTARILNTPIFGETFFLFFAAA